MIRQHESSLDCADFSPQGVAEAGCLYSSYTNQVCRASVGGKAIPAESTETPAP